MSTIRLWTCAWCDEGIGMGQTARADRGNFYHIPCWEAHLREQERLAKIDEERILSSRIDEYVD